MVVDVGDRGAAQARADVVPAEPAAGRMVAGVEPIAAVVGHVDAADERDLAVDNDGLLVVAVERMLARIGLAADPGAAGEGRDAVADLLARGMERRHRRARPHEHPHVGPLRDLGQEPAEHTAALPPDELEVGRDVPAGHVDVVARALERLGDQRERLGAVDQHLERAPFARPRIARRPRPVAGGGEGMAPAEAAKAPSMLGAHRRLDTVTYGRVDP